MGGLGDEGVPNRLQVFEGTYLHRRDGWWYLFASRGRYADWSYAIVVGRARKLTDDFVDREGRPLKEGFGTVILKSDCGDAFFGPGHNGDVFTSADGRTWMFYHSHDANLPRKSWRPCLLQELKWTSDGWPFFENGRPKIFESRFSL